MPKIIIECSSCNGTGLYVGESERDGAAVICRECEGTGYITFEYKKFKERKIRENVKRVFEPCNYVISATDIITKEGKLIKFSEAGCSYEEWLQGAKPKPIKDLYCPYIWRNTGMGHEPLEKCKENTSHSCVISDCKLYYLKEECWKEYEELNLKGE